MLGVPPSPSNVTEICFGTQIAYTVVGLVIFVLLKSNGLYDVGVVDHPSNVYPVFVGVVAAATVVPYATFVVVIAGVPPSPSNVTGISIGIHIAYIVVAVVIFVEPNPNGTYDVGVVDHPSNVYYCCFKKS